MRSCSLFTVRWVVYDLFIFKLIHLLALFVWIENVLQPFLLA